MRIARVTGRVSASVKTPELTGRRMLVTDVIDAAGTVLSSSEVVIDACGAGPGDIVLVTTGSAARLASNSSGIPTDATAVAFVDEISIGKRSVDIGRLSDAKGE